MTRVRHDAGYSERVYFIVLYIYTIIYTTATAEIDLREKTCVYPSLEYGFPDKSKTLFVR